MPETTTPDPDDDHMGPSWIWAPDEDDTTDTNQPA